MACEKENELALSWVEMKMFRWMCGIHQIDRYPSAALRVRWGLEEDIVYI